MGAYNYFLAKRAPEVKGCIPSRGAASTSTEFAAAKAARQRDLEERRQKKAAKKK